MFINPRKETGEKYKIISEMKNTLEDNQDRKNSTENLLCFLKKGRKITKRIKM